MTYAEKYRQEIINVDLGLNLPIGLLQVFDPQKPPGCPGGMYKPELQYECTIKVKVVGLVTHDGLTQTLKKMKKRKRLLFKPYWT